MQIVSLHVSHNQIEPNPCKVKVQNKVQCKHAIAFRITRQPHILQYKNDSHIEYKCRATMACTTTEMFLIRSIPTKGKQMHTPDINTHTHAHTRKKRRKKACIS